MGFFDFVSSLGEKAQSGDFAGLGQKLWSGANYLGNKASGIAHKVLDSNLGKVAIAELAGAEALPMAMGALSSFDAGLKASQSGEKQFSDWLKPPPKPQAPPKAPRVPGMMGYTPPQAPQVAARVPGMLGYQSEDAPPLPPRRRKTVTVPAPPLTGMINQPASFVPLVPQRNDYYNKQSELIRNRQLANAQPVVPTPRPAMTPAAANSLYSYRK